MCDYDGSWVQLGYKKVITRKSHVCCSCDQPWPAKTSMMVTTGISEGEFFSGHICPVCIFASDEKDHSELHLCLNWGYEPQGGYHRVSCASDTEVFNYLRYCHENGETPTVTHLTAIVRQIRIADGDWDEVA